MIRPSTIRLCFLALTLALTAVAGFPVRQAQAATCCELEYQSCVSDCGALGIDTFECGAFGQQGCKFFCECNR
jgi:hypothetical protein